MEDQTTSLKVADVLEEVGNLKKGFRVKKEEKNKVENILDSMLKGIKSIDFREYCTLDKQDDKLQKKHYLVSCIEILLKNVNDNGFSLCRKNEQIYLFNSEYWELLNEENFKDFLGKVALKMGVQKYDAKHHLFKEELYKQFLSDAGLEEIKSASTTTLINFNNGTFEITPTRQFLREFKKSDFLTYQLPFDYDEEATAPQFQNFLNDVLPEKELQEILAEYLGYVFTKNSVLKLEKVLLLYGTGANGKSVLFEVLMALLGTENVTNYSLQSLTAENGNSRAMLVNKLLNYASEINGKLESNIFKLLISGEPVEARLLYKNTQIITDYARFMFNCNELPKEVENTNAFFRRFIILPFRVTIPPHKQDKELSKKIIDSELSGVFNWVLIGLTRLLENKSFTDSEIVKDEIVQYQKESDSVLMFLEDENYQKSVTVERPLKELFAEYKIYCADGGYRLCSNRTFSTRLKKNGFIIKRKSYGNVVFIEVINVDNVVNVP
ncbi:phage/plasmid primase, P4 family [Tenacibaculum finnmarkense]|uniref:phage/plasmid primase, P4 family n=1 Tax=Tenacibaculum finnmarkense TaxID=2781243 RepID=UPI000C5D8AE4|nr:phage/plasmid primase, P4 family [Tenacibaculum finnmarkense]SOS55640.1 Phage/plasmid primase, P4 family [Tenacibaculum finnmarkense]